MSKEELIRRSDVSDSTNTSNEDSFHVHSSVEDVQSSSYQNSNASTSTENELREFANNIPHDETLDIGNNHSPQVSTSSSEQNSWIRENLQEFQEEDEDDENEYFDANEEWIYNNELHLIEDNTNFENLQRELNSDEAHEKIDGLAVSKPEMLLAILKFGMSFNLCQSGIADLCKMINCFLGQKILPDTRYLIDKIFNAENGIDFHAVCPDCKKYLKQFERQSNYEVTCQFCDKTILLKDPTYNHYFAIFNVNKEIELLIKENFEHVQSIFYKRLRNSENFSDLT
ncbi:uncharacterized protein LOC116417265 isoform X1 [Nasonia vitripennis]|uniref:Uncharacterized protein n=1 Tax=Nasonia vitripennis TaxID=7425 RepID=A0A7M7QLY8_NASVI|nr:uncharacterized protein LOC116417265 isoform X1 [Nasonia vitripennis]